MPQGRGLRQDENFWLHLTTVGAQCLRLSDNNDCKRHEWTTERLSGTLLCTRAVVKVICNRYICGVAVSSEYAITSVI